MGFTMGDVLVSAVWAGGAYLRHLPLGGAIVQGTFPWFHDASLGMVFKKSSDIKR